MPFWNLEQHGSNLAIIDGDLQLDFLALAWLADQHAARLPGGRGMGLLCMPSHIDAVAFYLGALRSGRQAPLLLQPDTDPTLLATLVAHYQPEWVASPGDPAEGYRTAYRGDALSLHVRDGVDTGTEPHPDLALLLSTSGSTGSSKLVRLSATGLDANASAIVDYLGLQPADRAITTLPLAYSFGMSILNSHLAVGGSVVLSNDSLMTREFWNSAREHGITSLSGVPATFEILHRMGLARLQLPSLRMLTQAGGRLRDDLVAYFAESSRQHGLAFYVMYGQTEASPRISYVPAARIADKVGSIGIPVPGGSMQVDPTTGELIYSGPNVMMGYAVNRHDLGKGDEMNGVLRTGDLARIDKDGFHYITGRAQRFLKISGNRVNLDEVEAMLSAALSQQIVCSGSDDDLVAFSHGETVAEQIRVRQLVQDRYKLFGGHVRAIHLDALPLMASGKVDYQSLRQMSGQGAAK